MTKFGGKALLALCVGALAVMVGGVTFASAASNDSKKKVSIAWFAQSNTTFTKAEEDGIRQAAKDAGNVTVKAFNANYDPQAQLRQCQDAIVSKKYNAFVIYGAAEGSLLSCIKQAVAQKIMISGIGTRLGTDKLKAKGVVTEYYTTPQQHGRAAYDSVRAACKAAKANPCEVGWLLAQRANPFSAARLAGTKELLKTNRAFKIVGEAETGFDNPDAGRSKTLELLQANPGIDVIATDDDGSAMGVEQGIKTAGKPKVKIIGFGSSKRGYAAVKAGRWYASLVNVPFTQGRAGAKDVITAVRGTNKTREKYIPGWDKSLTPIGSILTKENAGKFKPEW